MAKFNNDINVLVRSYKEGQLELLLIVDGKEVSIDITKEKLEELIDKNILVQL